MNETRSEREMRRLRIAVISTAVAIALALVLLIWGGDYLFTVFTVVGPLLLALAVVLLGWNILDELRAKKVL